MNDAGKISFLPKGEYDSGAMYEALDVVKYDGMVWAAKKSSKGITPAEGENWMCLLTAADYATADAPGIVKPDGDTIKVSTDATISVSSKSLAFADHDTAKSGISFTGAEDGNILVTDWTKNLLNPTLDTVTQNGVTCTNNGDGTYTLNGTAGENNSYLIFGSVDVVKGITYRMTGCPTGGAWNSYFIYSDIASGYDIGSGINWLCSETKSTKIRIVVSAGTTCDNITFKPMLTTDLNATYDDFVPYGGYEIKSCGKNLLEPTLGTTTSNGVTCTNNGDGTYTLNGTATGYCFFYLNREYKSTGNFKLVGVPYGTSSLMLRCTINNGGAVHDDVGNGAQFEIDESDTLEITIIVPSGATINNILIKPMLTTDLSATYDDYEPYTGENITVTNTTEAPAFGLKSHKGITNIISPANVKCVYPTNESGKGVLDAMYNNSQLSNELSKLKNAIIAMGGTV